MGEREIREQGGDEGRVLKAGHVGVVEGARDREAAVEGWRVFQKRFSVCGEVDGVRIYAAGRGLDGVVVGRGLEMKNLRPVQVEEDGLQVEVGDLHGRGE